MPKIQNIQITTPLENILTDIKSNCPGYLRDIRVSATNIMCTCPFHGNHSEKHPACSISISEDTKIPYGTFHCFACGESGSFIKFINSCFEARNPDFGKQWLLEHYGKEILEEHYEKLPEINLNATTKSIPIPDICLSVFDYNNPRALDYLINKRHIIKPVIDYFKIGYNANTDSITFPCWNAQGELMGIFERAIETKRFKIPEIYPKPVYLLNEVIKQHYETVFIVESQFNCLSAYSFGHPAVALFGTGSAEQYAILNKSGIRNYVLCFDGDEAGDIGRDRFIRNINKNTIISYKELPRGKDVNDLTKDEFEALPCYMV